MGSITTTQWYNNLDEVLGFLESQQDFHRRNEQRWRDALDNGGRVSGIQGKQSKTDCLQEVAKHKAAGDMAFSAREAIMQINPKLGHQVNHLRVPNFMCLTCGTQLDSTQLIHDNEYCEYEGYCANEPDFVVNYVEVHLPAGGTKQVRVCQKHLSDQLINDPGQVEVEPVDHTEEPEESATPALDEAIRSGTLRAETDGNVSPDRPAFYESVIPPEGTPERHHYDFHSRQLPMSQCDQPECKNA